MLPPAESDLARRDPALPGLATLLDPDALVVALRRAVPGVELGPAQIRYIKYNRGTNCLVSYQLAVAGGTVDIHAKAFSPEVPEKLSKARKKPGIPGPLGRGRLVLEDEAITVSVFPNDRKVTSLHRFADGPCQSELLRELLPERPELWDGRIEKLIYKPERRLVARLSTGGVPQAAIKVYSAGEYGGAAASATAFQSRGTLRFAPLLGRSDKLQVLVFDWINGRVLSEALLDDAFPLYTLAEVGVALAALHAQSAAGLLPLAREAEAAQLLEVARNLGWICPALAARAESIARRLAAELSAEPPVSQPIHGDFHIRQVILNDAGVTILDVDRAWCGDPMLDLGLFIAHLEREVIRGKLVSDRVAALSEALLDGYRAATGRPIPARARLYAAAELFRLAPRFFRYAEQDWPQKSEASLARVEALLADCQ